jgi:regulator of sigma E protease
VIGTSVVSVAVLLGVLIFIHELGHFLVAKWSGVGVLKFSLGFGPRLIGKKMGETEYMLSLIPLGGYVKLLGEAPDEELSPEDEKRSFNRQKVWKRIAIVAAGPVFNLLLALLIFTFVNIYGMPVMTAEVGNVQPDSAAFEAGLKKGDKIAAIDEQGVKKWDDISAIVTKSNGKSLLFSIARGSEALKIAIVPRQMKTHNIFGESVDSYKIGISPSSGSFVQRLNPVDAIVEGVDQTVKISKLTVLSIFKMFEGVVSPKTMGGPIFIAQIAGAQAKQGLVSFLLFMALLSINLGILNLLPIPVLDGGHLFFMAIELVTGREVKLRWREIAQQVGFTLLIMLMIFVFLMDIERLDIRFISDFIRKITG